MNTRTTLEQVRIILGYTTQCWNVSNFVAVASEGMSEREREELEENEDLVEMLAALREIGKLGSSEQIEFVRRLLATCGFKKLDFGKPRFTRRDWGTIHYFIRRRKEGPSRGFAERERDTE